MLGEDEDATGRIPTAPTAITHIHQPPPRIHHHRLGHYIT